MNEKEREELINKVKLAKSFMLVLILLGIFYFFVFALIIAGLVKGGGVSKVNENCLQIELNRLCDGTAIMGFDYPSVESHSNSYRCSGKLCKSGTGEFKICEIPYYIVEKCRNG